MKLTEENYVKTAENVIKKLIQEIEPVSYTHLTLPTI